MKAFAIATTGDIQPKGWHNRDIIDKTTCSETVESFSWFLLVPKSFRRPDRDSLGNPGDYSPIFFMQVRLISAAQLTGRRFDEFYCDYESQTGRVIIYENNISHDRHRKKKWWPSSWKSRWRTIITRNEALAVLYVTVVNQNSWIWWVDLVLHRIRW